MRRQLTLLLLGAIIASGLAVQPAHTSDIGTEPVAENRYLVRAAGDTSPVGARSLGFGWFRVDGAPSSAPGGFSELPTFPDTVYETASDPLEGDQWYLRNTGSDGGAVGADIDIATARELIDGAVGTPGTVVVAVLDSGVDTDHPDLTDQLWRNPDEVAGNGIDDDGNGYVDDVSGWDLIDDDNAPDDAYGHGTAVAGVLAASANGVGITGVASNVAVMPIRVCFSGSCPLSAIVEGIAYALDQGAAIINLSLGTRTYDPALDDAVEALASAGIVVVAAAGNDGTDNDLFPYYPASLGHLNIVSVTATDRTDSLGVFGSGGSNTGATSVDIAAPGVEIVTTDVGGWSERSGTSFAVPMVAGTLALVRGTRPQAPMTQLIDIVTQSGRQLADLQTTVASGARLDAGAAMLWAGATDFIDTTDSVFVNDIRWLSAYRITTGCNPPSSDRYCPRSSLTRGELAAFIRRALELPPTSTDAFTDDDENLFENDINALAAAGITKGCNPPDNTHFCPTRTLTRGEIAALLHRALELPPASTDAFTDDDENLFENDINALAAAGITKGCNPPDNTHFCPTRLLTRGEIAALLRRAFG